MIKRAYEQPLLKELQRLGGPRRVYFQGDDLSTQIGAALFKPGKNWTRFEAVIVGSNVKVVVMTPSMRLKNTYRFGSFEEAQKFLFEEIRDRVLKGAYSIYSRSGIHGSSGTLFGRYPMTTTLQLDPSIKGDKKIPLWIKWLENTIEDVISMELPINEVDPEGLERFTRYLKSFRDKKSSHVVQKIEGLLRKAMDRRSPMRGFALSNLRKIVEVLTTLK
jgi:hypothetical protein